MTVPALVGVGTNTDPRLHADYLRRYATSHYAPHRCVEELYRRAGIERR